MDQERFENNGGGVMCTDSVVEIRTAEVLSCCCVLGALCVLSHLTLQRSGGS